MRKFAELTVLEKMSVIAAGLLLLCLLPLPYGLYILFRLVIAVIAGIWAYRAYMAGRVTEAVIAGVVALVFQPFFKLMLGRLLWCVVDVILIVFLILIFMRKR